jgi:hypothetical protein
MSTSIIRNDEDIISLIKCEKTILKKPPNPKESNRDIKRTFSVVSADESLEFEIFFAENAKLPEDFSIGLMYNKFLLLRCNGFHGTTNAGFHRFNHHAQVHSHTLTYNDITNGREEKPSKIDDLSGKYFCFQSAQLYFLKICNVNNFQNFFDYSKLDQITIEDF